MNTKDIITAADNFLVKNDIRELPISMTTLEGIAKRRKWVLLSYSSKAAQSFIADLGLEEAAKKHKAFSTQVQSQHIIFYDDNVSYNDKIHCICHEIGHIVLHHTTECQMVGYSSDVDVDEEQEAEANAFAAEMMAPVCILVKARIKSVSDLIGLGYISAEQASLISSRSKPINDTASLSSSFSRLIFSVNESSSAVSKLTFADNGLFSGITILTSFASHAVHSITSLHYRTSATNCAKKISIASLDVSPRKSTATSASFISIFSPLFSHFLYAVEVSQPHALASVAIFTFFSHIFPRSFAMFTKLAPPICRRYATYNNHIISYIF